MFIHIKQMNRLILLTAILIMNIAFVLQTNVSYASSNNNYADNFDNGSGGSTGKNGNDGSLLWNSDWSGDSSDGVWVQKMSGWCASGYCLRLLANSNPQSSSERSANLEAVISATITFDYKVYLGGGSSSVDISPDGINYISLDSLTGEGNATYTIPSSYLTANFRVRFRSNGSSWTDLYIDNVQLNVDDSGSSEPDSDTDGIPDSTDNCPSIANPDQADSDGNGVGNVCDNDPTGNYADDFDNGNGGSTNNNGNDGTLLWSSNWSGDSSDGVWIQQLSGWCASGYCLRLLANTNPQVTSERRANLASATAATVSFDYKTYLGSGSATVEFSSDGVNYNTFASLPNEGNISYTLPSSYLTADFRLRFRSSGSSWTDLFVDNVQLSVNGTPSSEPSDSDTDGIPDSTDNCPIIANTNQTDSDGDGTGDACDSTPNSSDQDADGIPDSTDNCPAIANADQTDNDHDGVGNVCDTSPDGADQDADGVLDNADNCPTIANPNQADSDSDGIGDVCDSVAPNNPSYSAGCGLPANTGIGYQDILSNGIQRKYYLSVPQNYDPNNNYQLVFGFHGINYDGIRMRDYLRLEQTSYADQTIFVYPNALPRYWPQWNYNRIGWLTGQISDNEDFILFDDVLAEVANNYCIDLSRVYVTGQSWGGDMATSLPCARGNDIAAATSVAANDPHYFDGYPGYFDTYPTIQPSDCERPVPMITYHGAGDTVVFGTARASDWWFDINECQISAGEHTDKENIYINGSYEDQACQAPNIYILYENDNSSYQFDGQDHQIPENYETETMNFFSQHTLP